MKFTEMRTTMEGFSGAPTPDYQLLYMTTEAKDLLTNLGNRFVEYLTNDITGTTNNIDFKIWLGNKYYGPSNDNAKECLELCIKVEHIYGRRIKPWTDNALKCFDNFLLKYIQDDRGEIIKPQTAQGKERDVYQHLIEKGGDIQGIGQAFDLIYQTRNEFQHVQIIDSNGHRIPRNISNSKCNNKRDLIVGWFKTALEALMNDIKG